MPPKARAKLSAAKRAKKKCDSSGGEAKAKRSYAPGKRQDAIDRANVNLGPWRNFFRQFPRNYELDHNEAKKSYRELQQPRRSGGKCRKVRRMGTLISEK